ncbi:MocR-like pyridoxine biosynthesis transcription factor PdxR [Balneatrix alpica]|uniref:PLP-dependent aminotransferase family protein n=1 Tax=Balneatrix alpica TaxID=75684 RepID=A0ABV5Z7Q5_9GAMM|nr:PLP-dependent aminotransferase family protein [Balneatrix alpica]
MRRAGGVMLSQLALDREQSTPLYRQLYLQLRQLILNGVLPPGCRLPSTRTLAKELDVSRITVISVFDQLLAEGFLISQAGSGTYVNAEVQHQVQQIPSNRNPIPRVSGWSLAMSRRSQRYTKIGKKTWYDYPNCFVPSSPAFDQFPRQVWNKLHNRYLHHPGIELLSYGDSRGYEPLREALVDYLRDVRGLVCRKENIVVVTGATQAINYLGWLLLDAGDVVWMEDPGHVAARLAFSGTGARVLPVPIDSQGIDVGYAETVLPQAKLLFSTPSRQHPLCITMPMQRRLELLQWAARADAWVIEDDCESELYFHGRPPNALYTLDPNSRVIYVGTLSKVMFPGLRLGYVVMPEELVEAWCALCTVMDRPPPNFTQAVVADFMAEGHLISHIRRMRELYAGRQQRLVALLQQHCGDFFELQQAQAGLQLLAWLPPGLDDRQVSEAILQEGVDAYPLSHWSVNPNPRGALLLGFAGVPEAEMQRGVKAMARALRRQGWLS